MSSPQHYYLLINQADRRHADTIVVLSKNEEHLEDSPFSTRSVFLPVTRVSTNFALQPHLTP